MTGVCAICNEVVKLEDLIKISNSWTICCKHGARMAQLEYRQRCNNCMGYINVGEQAIIGRVNEKWVALHSNDSFCHEAEPWTKNYKSFCDELLDNLDVREVKTAHDVLYVTKYAPMEVIKASYRALSLLYHPDYGGDDGKMKELNNAMDKILGKK